MSLFIQSNQPLPRNRYRFTSKEMEEFAPELEFQINTDMSQPNSQRIEYLNRQLRDARSSLSAMQHTVNSPDSDQFAKNYAQVQIVAINTSISVILYEINLIS